MKKEDNTRAMSDIEIVCSLQKEVDELQRGLGDILLYAHDPNHHSILNDIPSVRFCLDAVNLLHVKIQDQGKVIEALRLKKMK